MKKIYFILCSLVVLFTACQDEFQDATYISNTEISAHSSTADVLIYVSNQDGGRSRATVEEFGVFLSTNANPTDKDERHSLIIKGENWDVYRQVYSEYGGYVFTVEGLSANTTYYALPFISNRWGIVTGKVVSFTTNGTAKVTTKAATQVTATTAQLNATVELVGEEVSLEKRGFVMSTSNNPTIEDNNSTNWAEVGKTGDYGVKYTGLQSSTRYYFRGYVVVDGETLYGNVLNFTTLTPDDAITFSLNDATEITKNSAYISGSITIGKDAVGSFTECGFMVALESNPTYNSSGRIAVRWNSNSNVETWSGTKNLHFTLTDLQANTTYYYRMYYRKEGQDYYDNTIKTFRTTGSSQSYYTVSQIMSVYNSLGLASGATSTDTYTVRGYVTKWNSGYPDYQNADFFIDDSANGSTSNFKCFRLTGVNESDKRTLVVGDYIEAQNCHLMNYNGQAELKDGTFTVIKAASSGVPKLSDFLGTYSCHAHRQKNNDYVDWNNVVISSYTEDLEGDVDIMVEGLIYGISAYTALGKFEETNGYIRLYGGWYLEEKQCTITSKGETLLNPIFYPMYVNGTDTSYISNNENDADFMGEILLVRNSDGTISLQPSNKADSYGRYANVYRFDYFLASDKSYTNYNTVFYLLNGTTLTKTSSATSAPAKMQGNKTLRRR
ncbi:MAG: hypothetical protein IJT35_08490 [Paludibacteraceae bacterium]|nr:hypothetical protein [Paludibacteraceae bacterium]